MRHLGSSLTDGAWEIIVEATRRGLPIDVCADMAGVTGPTLRNWLKTGSKVDPHHCTPDERRLYEFRREYLKAQAENIDMHVQHIRSTDKWEASAWFLKKRYRHLYGDDTDQVGRVFAMFLADLEKVLPHDAYIKAVETLERTVEKLRADPERGEGESFYALPSGDPK